MNARRAGHRQFVMHLAFSYDARLRWDGMGWEKKSKFLKRLRMHLGFLIPYFLITYSLFL